MLSSDETLNDDALASHVARFPSSLNPLMLRHRRWSLLDYVRCEYAIGTRARLVSGLGDSGTYLLLKDVADPDEQSNVAYLLYRGCQPKMKFCCGGLYRGNDVVNAYFHSSPEHSDLTVTAFFPLGFESWCQLLGNPAFGVRHARQGQRSSSVFGVHACSDAIGMLLSVAVKLSARVNLHGIALLTQTSQTWSAGVQCIFGRWGAVYSIESNAYPKVQLFVDISDQLRVAFTRSHKTGIEFVIKH